MLMLQIVFLLVIILILCAKGKRVTKTTTSSTPQQQVRRLDDTEIVTATKKTVTTASASDHLVEFLPDAPKLMYEQYAGFLYGDAEGDANIFYWLFESQTGSSDKDPLVVWLNGGPGCSSMDGLFIELGPFKMHENGSITTNEYSWHKFANLLFIDQPVGTGLSFTLKRKYAKNDIEVNTKFYYFLKEFFKTHSKFKGRDLYLAGESHAGHYIPSIAKYIIENNKRINSDVIINIKGLLIGNGWIDPINQYDVSDFAYQYELINEKERLRLKKMDTKCRNYIKRGNLNTKVCFDLLDEIVLKSGDAKNSRINMYDIRQYTKIPNSFPPNHELVEAYMNRNDVKVALHASKSRQRFKECADPPYFALQHQDGKSIVTELVQLLEMNVNILFFSGQFDMICNHIGSEKALNDLKWSGQENWQKASSIEWKVNGRRAGFLKEYGSLKYLLVVDAGHMVPLNQPATSLDMLYRFLKNLPFDGSTEVVTAAMKLQQSLTSSFLKPIDNFSSSARDVHTNFSSSSRIVPTMLRKNPDVNVSTNESTSKFSIITLCLLGSTIAVITFLICLCGHSKRSPNIVSRMGGKKVAGNIDYSKNRRGR